MRNVRNPLADHNLQRKKELRRASKLCYAFGSRSKDRRSRSAWETLENR